MAMSPNGLRLYVALDDRNQVVEADAVALKETRRIDVPGGPTGLALDSSGKRLFVTCRSADRLLVIETDGLTPVGSVEVGRGPVGVAYCAGVPEGRVVVANAASDDISVLSLAPLREIVRLDAGREPYAVATSADGSRAFIANRLSITGRQSVRPASELTVVDPVRGRVVSRERLDSAHLSEGVAVVPERSWVVVPLVKVCNMVPITQVASGWVMSSGLALVNDHGLICQLPLDEANSYYADPSGVVADAGGKRLYVASGGGDVVTIVDLGRLARWLGRSDKARRDEAIEDLSLAPDYVLGRIPTGRNPRQLALSPDGAKLFVAERLQDSILVVDTTTLRQAGRIQLGDGGADDPIRRGERVFTRASYTFQSQFSCRSCHPDGHVDGLSYDFDGDGIGDNLLDNRSLQGVAGTGPFKWNGKNPSLQVQCGPRFARVLMRTDPIPTHDLNDLVAFLESLPPPRGTRRPDQPLTESQDRGREIFFATATPAGAPIPRARQCQTCHRPPLFTNRLPAAIGTKGPRDTTEFFDTPHLLGIGASAPYLHDGRAQTLEELWTVYQTNDLHGVTSYMNKQQLNDLVEYLKTL